MITNTPLSNRPLEPYEIGKKYFDPNIKKGAICTQITSIHNVLSFNRKDTIWCTIYYIAIKTFIY